MLDILIKSGISEHDIFTNYECPKIIWYDDKKTKHTHIPDIFIKSENKLIEVKSEFTSSVELMNNILLKKKYSEEQGYTYIINILNKKGEIIKTII